jgi:hypothetical protein
MRDPTVLLGIGGLNLRPKTTRQHKRNATRFEIGHNVDTNLHQNQNKRNITSDE